MLYKRVELKDGVEVQFVGVYVLKWKKEWGQPEVGFVEVEDTRQDDSPDANQWCDCEYILFKPQWGKCASCGKPRR